MATMILLLIITVVAVVVLTILRKNSVRIKHVFQSGNKFATNPRALE